MKLGRLNHVGVATPSIEQSLALYRNMFGAEPHGPAFDLPAQGVRVCFVDTPNSQIELIEPLGPTSPIAMNESTQFISPTKTPEYLAGGKPVVSTPVRDVVRHYGQMEGVQIASTPDEFVAACERALELARNPEGGWLAEADLILSATSWDTVQARMAGLIGELLGEAPATKSAILVAAE
jgi:catechol 2,3-dioxygenase-like lactoylglutathione lyase family enzyme